MDVPVVGDVEVPGERVGDIAGLQCLRVEHGGFADVLRCGLGVCGQLRGHRHHNESEDRGRRDQDNAEYYEQH